MNAYRPRKNNNYSYDYKKNLTDIRNYSESKGETSNLIYGKEAIIAFFSDVKKLIQEGKDFPIQSVYIVYEHKLMMYERIKYMVKKGYLQNANIVNEYKKVKELFYSVLLMCIKYRLTYRDNVGEKIKNRVTEGLEMEDKIIGGIFSA